MALFTKLNKQINVNKIKNDSVSLLKETIFPESMIFSLKNDSNILEDLNSLESVYALDESGLSETDIIFGNVLDDISFISEELDSEEIAAEKKNLIKMNQANKLKEKLEDSKLKTEDDSTRMKERSDAKHKQLEKQIQNLGQEK